ncbi:MAG TPA: hypothetical protein V6D28_11035 [Leptolyngbyaceae cyanobacterium]|nr:hypothetical protein [Nostocaceae cyanobacterium]
MDNLSLGLEIIKFIVSRESFDDLNISQHAKDALKVCEKNYQTISDTIDKIDPNEITKILSEINEGGEGKEGLDSLVSSSKSSVLYTDVIITGVLYRDKGSGTDKPGSKKLDFSTNITITGGISLGEDVLKGGGTIGGGGGKLSDLVITDVIMTTNLSSIAGEVEPPLSNEEDSIKKQPPMGTGNGGSTLPSHKH